MSSATLPCLQRFELSTTAFGKPDLASVRSLLSNSHVSLRTLSFRNKGAASDALEAFKSVAATLIQDHAERLEELVIQDVPRFPGQRREYGRSSSGSPSRTRTLTALVRRARR